MTGQRLSRWQHPRQFAFFAALQFASYLNLTVNYRAVAHEQYAWAALSDAVACVLGWTTIKMVAGADGWAARTGYVLGGASAAMVGIWLTRAWG